MDAAHPATARASPAETSKTMPEITDAQLREYGRYSALGTPEELEKQKRDLERVKEEAAERRKELKAKGEELDALKAKVPSDDAVILTGDEAAAYKAVAGAGLTLKQVDDAVKERDTLKREKTSRERKEAIRKAAPTEGWAPESAEILHRLLGDETPFELKEEQVESNGKKETKPVGYVTKDGRQIRLSEWAKGEELPAAMFTAQANGSSAGGGLYVPEQRGQGGGNGKATGAGIDSLIASNQAAAKGANPLRPAKAG